jgi:hypothetical protein
LGCFNRRREALCRCGHRRWGSFSRIASHHHLKAKRATGRWKFFDLGWTDDDSEVQNSRNLLCDLISYGLPIRVLRRTSVHTSRGCGKCTAVLGLWLDWEPDQLQCCIMLKCLAGLGIFWLFSVGLAQSCWVANCNGRGDGQTLASKLLVVNSLIHAGTMVRLCPPDL